MPWIRILDIFRCDSCINKPGSKSCLKISRNLILSFNELKQLISTFSSDKQLISLHDDEDDDIYNFNADLGVSEATQGGRRGRLEAIQDGRRGRSAATRGGK